VPRRGGDGGDAIFEARVEGVEGSSVAIGPSANPRPSPSADTTFAVSPSPSAGAAVEVGGCEGGVGVATGGGGVSGEV
jgi:hypothetical protein